MKVFLDDVRNPPNGGWVCIRSVAEAIMLIDEGVVEVMSLDHDLGDTEHDPEWTGNTVVNYIERKVAEDDTYNPPNLMIHSANPIGRMNMQAGIANIDKMLAARAPLPAVGEGIDSL